jgi:Mn-dependent DtxR family transcriptional regulator
MLSDAAQDYMKQIYLLERRDGKASTSALAEAMGVSAASATAMVKKLATLGLVEHSRYHGVTLTPPGEKVALEVIRHHRLLEVYLTQTLGLSWDRVHSEAERLEHVLSEELEAEIDRALDEHPDAELLIHPECGCASQCMYAASENPALGARTHVLSTEGMVQRARTSPRREFMVATETGILHRLGKEAPDARFYAMSERAVCRYMKMITLEKLRDSLLEMRHRVTVDPELAARARGAIQRMVEIT